MARQHGREHIDMIIDITFILGTIKHFMTLIATDMFI